MPIKSHKIQLNPTKAQRLLLHQSFGIARHSYNWALAKWQELYKTGEKPSAYSLIKLQNSIKKTEFPFYLEVSKNAPQYAIHNLEKAFKKMWKDKTGYPKFKKKGVKDSFMAVENLHSFKQKNKKIWLPRIGWVKCYENLRFEGKVNNVIVRRIANKYYAVVNIDVLDSTPTLKQSLGDNQAIVGVDLGIKTFATFSDGIVIENKKALKTNLKSLKRLQRGLSKKTKGSNNKKKQQKRLTKKHWKISNIRRNVLHQATTFLVKNYSIIVIEDLNVKGMAKNRKLSQAISDVGFGEFRRQLEYKSKWYGCELVVADRFFASSKTCSCCGHKKETLKLSERIFKCQSCGISLDRDLNASLNLKNYALRRVNPEVKPVEKSQTLSQDSSGSMKQEITEINNNFESSKLN